MLRILHLCTSRSWGGMEMIVCRLAQLQRQSGHEVAFACDRRAPISDACSSNGVVPLDVRCDLAGLVALRKYIGRFRPDIMHVQYSRDLNIAVPANFGNSSRIILTKQLESAVGKRDPWHRLLYGGVSRATAISAMIRDNLAATTPLRPEQIDLVHLGIDVDRFQPDPQARAKTRREMGITADALAVGMMGRMSPGKGFDDFIEMASQLNGDDLRFVLIGGHSRNEDAFGAGIEAKAREQLGGRAFLTGHREDRQRYLAALDLFVFPSYAESFGLALVEAMATGMPCVAYGAGGVLDIIDHGRDGLRAQAMNIADLRDKTQQLIGDAALRAALGTAARAKAVDSFSEHKMLAGIERTYRRALA